MGGVFQKVESKIHLQDELTVVEFWEREQIFELTYRLRKGKPRFVFYEGPPTANGRPHVGHLLPRIIKDLFPRHKTMRGYYVVKRGGWDTHGLPVELEVERELGLSTKLEIEEYGIERFIKKCRESVFRYKGEWEAMMRRYGFWIDLAEAYVTCENYYVESLWWILKQFFDQDLLYKGHKVVPYCSRCETTLSSHEVSLGYRTARDPSIFVKFELRDEPKTYILAWTTTPWTLPSNVALAVNRHLDYVMVEKEGERLILAANLLERVVEPPYDIVKTFKGEYLEGKRYQPLFEPGRELLFTEDLSSGYRVVHCEFVEVSEGTGVVHIAPAFGEEDYQVGQEEGLPFVQPVDLQGQFTEEFPLGSGRFVKVVDPEITERLRGKGQLLREASYEHEYPFCWRCDTPLLYYARSSWFIRTTAFKEKVLQNNDKISWYPSYTGKGRFQDFLENMVDWALSRERYWGTPLNIWICSQCEHKVSVGGREELVELAVDKAAAEKVEFHKPYIDEIRLRCPKCEGEMERTPEVIDAWFDSGCMHTAQWHYPFEDGKRFKEVFPGDFIAEAQDQTRGWFYTLLVTSAFLYDEPAYKNCVVTGLMLDEQGQKMSKSKGNVIYALEATEEFTADAIRWYFFSNSYIWNYQRFDTKAIREKQWRFLGTLKSSYAFFVLYANIDGFDPRELKEEELSFNFLDRWLLSRLEQLKRRVIKYLDRYDCFSPARLLEEFVVEDLSNWYIRCQRRRFWRAELDQDKQAGYWVLYYTLVELAKLLAPFTPFLTEEIYQNLVRGLYPEEPVSVHLCYYSEPVKEHIKLELEQDVARLRVITEQGLSLRNQAKLKVRQPLGELKIFVPGSGFRHDQVVDDYLQLLKEQLNIKEVVLLPEWDAALEGDARYRVGEAEGIKVALRIEITPELWREGVVREFLHKLQFLRKEAGFEVTDRIEMAYEGGKQVVAALEEAMDFIKAELLCDQAKRAKPVSEEFEKVKSLKFEGEALTVGIRRRKQNHRDTEAQRGS